MDPLEGLENHIDILATLTDEQRAAVDAEIAAPLRNKIEELDETVDDLKHEVKELRAEVREAWRLLLVKELREAIRATERYHRSVLTKKCIP